MTKHYSLPIRLLFFATLLFPNVLAKAQYIFAEEGFMKEVVTDEVEFPTGITFDENGQGYIWTKQGKIYILSTEGTVSSDPILDISDEVDGSGDHGLLGFVLDPNFHQNGHFYISYKVDRYHLLHHDSPNYDSTITWIYGASIGRVTRYTADINSNFQSVDEDSRYILLGTEKTNGVPQLHNSHGMGTILFASDGSLLVGTGDGATWVAPYTGGGPPYFEEFVESALSDSIIPPEQEVGSYRSQQVQSYNGKILRINPETGEGYPSNPFYQDANPHSAQSKVWSLGFRNPFRFRLQPGTGESQPSAGDPGVVFVSDVGYSSREELNIVNAPGQNFGWPHFEGILPHEGYVTQLAQNPYAPNPSSEENCENTHYLFQDLILQNNLNPIEFSNPCDTNEIIYPFTFEHQLPSLTYEHAWSDPEGIGYVVDYNPDGTPSPLSIATPESGLGYSGTMTGAAMIGGCFYMGEAFPQEYHELFFAADYTGWIKAFEVSESGELLVVKNFLDQGTEANTINHIEYNPHDESIYLIESNTSQIIRVYYGEEEDPVAKIETSEKHGISPLNIQLDGGESYSPIGSELTYLWTVEGENYTEESFNIELTSSSLSPQEVPIALVVTDEEGRTDSTTISISLNNSPPKVQIAPFSEGEYYPMDFPSGIPLTAYISDSEENNNDLNVKWSVFIHHNQHYHTHNNPSNQHSSVSSLSPIGCGDQLYYYRIQLEVEDNFGLKTTRNLELEPYCEPDSVPIFTTVSYEALSTGTNLTWSASYPEDIEKVIILRGETEFDLFPIDTVEVNGNPEINSYLDYYPPHLTSYYSIKLMTSANVFRFSTVQKVVNEPRVGDFMLFPNPSDEFVTVISKSFTGSYSLSIFSANGKKVLEFSGHNETNIEEEFPIYHLADGIYIVQLETDDFTAKQKLVVAHK